MANIRILLEKFIDSDTFNAVASDIYTYAMCDINQYIIKKKMIQYLLSGIIILYSKSTLNAYSLLSQKLWVPLIKFMMGPTTSVRGGSIHLIYFRST